MGCRPDGHPDGARAAGRAPPAAAAARERLRQPRRAARRAGRVRARAAPRAATAGRPELPPRDAGRPHVRYAPRTRRRISALVSARYAPLDAVELVDTVRGTLRDLGLLPAVRVRSVASGLVDVLRLVFPAESRAVRVGDVTALGIDISTSSFGRSAVHIRGLLWRLQCTNGLRVREGVGSISIRHVGDGDRLRAGIAEAIPSVFAHAQGAMTRWQNAVRFMIDDVAAQVAALQDLTQAEQKLVTEEIRFEAGTPALPERVDAFTFLNGITAAARSAVPSRRLELESLAGRLLDQRVPS
ncbi:MAG: DUF932 domain-containing protein [Myxococcales bacterium]|nr:DUF932 domain-containing protein [Myxococcales bacterium]